MLANNSSTDYAGDRTRRYFDRHVTSRPLQETGAEGHIHGMHVVLLLVKSRGTSIST